MHLHPINGAAQRVGADETAFGHRDKMFSPVIAGIWDDPAENEEDDRSEDGPLEDRVLEAAQAAIPADLLKRLQEERATRLRSSSASKQGTTQKAQNLSHPSWTDRKAAGPRGACSPGSWSNLTSSGNSVSTARRRAPGSMRLTSSGSR